MYLKNSSDMINMEEIESVSYGERIDENKSKGEDSVNNSDSENESDDDVDNDDEKLLRCKKCIIIFQWSKTVSEIFDWRLI